jgi:hypothetical protein
LKQKLTVEEQLIRQLIRNDKEETDGDDDLQVSKKKIPHLLLNFQYKSLKFIRIMNNKYNETLVLYTLNYTFGTNKHDKINLIS